MISPFYGINPAKAENPYFFPYLFQGLNDVIMSWKFTGIIFWKQEDLGAREASKRRPDGQRRVPHAAPVPGHVGPPLLGLVAPFATIILPEASSWHKNAYIKSLPTFFEERAATREKQETETRRLQILEGGNSGGALPDRSPSSPSTSPPSPWWRGSSPPLDYWFVAVAYVSLSLLSFTN